MLSAAFRPRVAIVGAGVAGLFTARFLQRGGFKVDLFDKRRELGGILPSHVAVDHLDTLAVCRDFSRWLEKENDHVNFFPGVTIKANDLVALRERYEAVILATGCEQPTRLKIPGGDLTNVVAGSQIAESFRTTGDALDVPISKAVIVGAGNVALDVARVLSAASAGSVEMPGKMRAQKGQSLETTIILRRGLLDVSCSPAELRELLDHPDLQVSADPADLDEALAADGLSRVKRKLQSLFASLACAVPLTETESPAKVTFLAHTVPTKYHGRAAVESVSVVRRNEERLLAADLVAECLGFQLSDDQRELVREVVPETGPSGRHFPNANGLVHSDAAGRQAPLYCVGWCRRGPSGGVNVAAEDARAVAERVLHDI